VLQVDYVAARTLLSEGNEMGVEVKVSASQRQTDLILSDTSLQRTKNRTKQIRQLIYRSGVCVIFVGA
jgi:hypothetical protein